MLIGKIYLINVDLISVQLYVVYLSNCFEYAQIMEIFLSFAIDKLSYPNLKTILLNNC